MNHFIFLFVLLSLSTIYVSFAGAFSLTSRTYSRSVILRTAAPKLYTVGLCRCKSTVTSTMNHQIFDCLYATRERRTSNSTSSSNKIQQIQEEQRRSSQTKTKRAGQTSTRKTSLYGKSSFLPRKPTLPSMYHCRMK